MITRLRPQPTDARDQFTAATRKVADLTAELAQAVADLAAITDAARDRLAADSRLAYDVGDAAKACGVSRQTIERWTQAPDPLPFSRIENGSKFVTQRDLLDFLRRHRCN